MTPGCFGALGFHMSFLYWVARIAGGDFRLRPRYPASLASLNRPVLWTEQKFWITAGTLAAKGGSETLGVPRGNIPVHLPAMGQKELDGRNQRTRDT